MVVGVVVVEPPRCVASMPIAAPPPTTAAMIRIFAVRLMPPPAEPPEVDDPSTLVCVMIALAVCPPKEADTRISILPAWLLKRIPRATAWPWVLVAVVREFVPLVKVPPGPWFGRKKVTEAPANGLLLSS